MNIACRTLLSALLPALITVTAAAQGTAARTSPDEIVRLSDMSRNGWECYAVRTVIRDYEDGELTEEGAFDVTIRGADRTLVKFLNPDVKGRYLLMVEDDMWIYMPNTRKPIRITPLQRLMGDASNGDVARTHYAADYRATFAREDAIEGVPCSVLELAAKRDAATYKRIEYWVAKGTYRPLRAEIYLASGKHYKTVDFNAYREVLGHTLLAKMTITDRIREGRTTIMLFESYAERDVPEKYFNKDHLESLR
jgi:outer membrane lipoprotein-sorting protein